MSRSSHRSPFRVACRPLVVLALVSAFGARASAAVTGDTGPAVAPQAPAAASKDPYTLAKPWIDGAMQIRDAAQRDAAIASIRAAIASTDPIVVRAGLLAFNRIRTVTFDRAGFRAIVLPHLDDKEAAVRIAAMYGLDSAGREEGDLERVLKSAEGITGAERAQLVHVIATFSSGNLTGPAGAVVQQILSSDDLRFLHQALPGIWGAKVSPEIEARLVAMSNGKDPQAAHEAIYFGLSTLRDKSAAVVDRLIAALADADPNNSDRALWGLGHGVMPSLETKVADALLELLEARNDATTRNECLRMLQLYGVEAHAVALGAIAKRPAVDVALVGPLNAAAAAIRRRVSTKPK